MDQKAEDFKNQYNGTHIDEDGYYGAQCWDLVARYAREKWGCPSFPTGSGGAEGLYRVFADPLGQYFTKVANDTRNPNQFPPKGAIIIWSAAYSPPYGHTALVLGADSSGVTVFEQNGNNPGGNAYVTKRAWNPNIYGWLVPKETIQVTTPSITTLRIVQSEVSGGDRNYIHSGQFDKAMLDAHGWKDVNAFVYEMWVAGGGYRQQKDTWEAFYNQYNSQIAELTARPTKASYDQLTAALATSADTIKKLQAELALQSDDTKNLNAFGIALKWFITRVGLSK